MARPAKKRPSGAGSPESPVMIKLSSIVAETDSDFYPRRGLDNFNVIRIRDALIVGKPMPPVLVWKRGRNYFLIDGFHRVKAYRKVYGADGEILAFIRTYKNEGDALIDAAEANATHGRRLDETDRAHIANLADKLGVSLVRVADALNMPYEKFVKLIKRRRAFVERVRDTKAERSQKRKGRKRPEKYLEPVAIKGSLVPVKSGKILTEEQVGINRRAGGMHQMWYVNRVIDLLEGDLVDAKNRGLLERMAHLRDLLTEYLPD